MARGTAPAAPKVSLQLLLLGLSFLVLRAAASPPPQAASVYEALDGYGLPRGVLPQGVTSYSLSAADGSFQVSLPASCDVKAGSRTVRYDPTVSGVIANGTIDKLDGVHVKLLIWIAITAVRRDGDQLQFRAGLLSESFPAQTFSAPPACLPQLT